VSGNANVVPFSIFVPLSYQGEQVMQIYASDGFGSSEPIRFGIQDIFERVRNTGKGCVGSGTSPNAIIESGLMKVGSILPNTAKISSRFDDNDLWCDESSSPLSMKSLPIPGNSASYITPGDHKITYQFKDDLNNVMNVDYYYSVNNVRKVELILK
jgi:hypothetical protein